MADGQHDPGPEEQAPPAPRALRFERVSERYDASGFDCGGATAILTNYVQGGYILRDERLDRSRGYYLIEDEERIVGYFTLQAGFLRTDSIADDALPGVTDVLFGLPVIIIEMLARHKDRRGAGYGAILLVEAVARSVRAAETIGAVGVFLVAVSAEAYRLYSGFGFRDFDGGAFNHHNRMLLPMSEARGIAARAGEGREEQNTKNTESAFSTNAPGT